MRPNLQCFERITICKVQKGFSLKNVSFEICRMVPSMIEAFLYLEAGGDFKNIDIKCNHSVGHFKTFFVWLYEKHLKKGKKWVLPLFSWGKTGWLLRQNLWGDKKAILIGGEEWNAMFGLEENTKKRLMHWFRCMIQYLSSFSKIRPGNYNFETCFNASKSPFGWISALEHFWIWHYFCN